MQDCVDLTSDGESPAGGCAACSFYYFECIVTGQSQLLCFSDETIWPLIFSTALHSSLKHSNRHLPVSCDYARILDREHAGPSLAAVPCVPEPCITLLSSDEERSPQKPVVKRNTAAAGGVPQVSVGPGFGSVNDGPSGSLPQSSCLSPVRPSLKVWDMQPVEHLSSDTQGSWVSAPKTPDFWHASGI